LKTKAGVAFWAGRRSMNSSKARGTPQKSVDVANPTTSNAARSDAVGAASCGRVTSTSIIGNGRRRAMYPHASAVLPVPE
jgi:hypothetical protein